jgi:hypothetical protein
MAVRAPALPTEAAWLNVERPLATEELRGKVLLLHFFTYC